MDDTQHVYKVMWSAEDREWVATVEGWPLLSWLADEPDEALAGLVKLLKEVDNDRN